LNCEFLDGQPKVRQGLEARSLDAAPITERYARPPAGKNLAGRFVGRRKVKPKSLAVITTSCTGCAGSPVCQSYCPVEQCMVLVRDERAYPFQRIVVDPLKCVGCKKCLRRGPAYTFLEGCPWDAIIMVSTSEWEAEHGQLPY
jgi:ferredoxin